MTTSVDPLADVLAQSSFATIALLSKIGAEHDLSLTQLRVMSILRDRRLRMTALADHLGLDKSTMTGLVSRAEKRRLLTRAPADDDRRAVDVFLTSEGQALAGQLYRDFTRELGEVTARLSAADQQRLQTLLRRITG